MSDMAVELGVLLVGDLRARPRPEGGCLVERALALLRPREFDRHRDVVGVVAHDVTQRLRLGEFQRVVLEVEDDVRATARTRRGLDLEGAAAVAGPAPCLLGTGPPRDDLDPRGVLGTARRQQLPALGSLVLVDVVLRFDGRRRLRKFRDQSPQRGDRVIKSDRIRVKGLQPLIGRFNRKAAAPGEVRHHLHPNIEQVPVQRGMVLLLPAQVIDVIQTGPAVNLEVLLVLPEEFESLAEEEQRNQCQHEHRHHRITPKEELHQLVARQSEEAKTALRDREAGCFRGVGHAERAEAWSRRAAS